MTMIVPVFWFSAAAGIVYDFLRYISRETGLSTIWRHIFESIVLLMSAIYAWDWMEETGTLNPVFGLAGRIIILLSLMALVYSSYRNSIISLWIDIAVNCFLLAGLVFTISYAVSSDTFGLCVLLGLPVNILFIQALLVNYDILRARYPQQGKKVPSPAIPYSNIVPNFSSTVGRLPDVVRGTDFSETTTDTGL
ncbi:MAG TPA: hypothetical protein VK518_21580 [Puia sp.]|nr:hypothetical protein [Puia sp.]